MRPFAQLPFDALPERPRRPHPFFDHPRQDLQLASRAYGRVRLAYREAGSGPPLLLVHGLMTSSYSWRYVLEPLARRYRVIAPDLVGCGLSDKPEGSYAPAALAGLVADFIRALGIGPCYLVGNSLGGYLGMRLALDEPEVVERVLDIHSPGVSLVRLRALAVALALPGADGLLDLLVRRHPLRWAHRNVHYFDESLKSLEEAREYGEPLSTPRGRRAFASYLRDTLAPKHMATFVDELGHRPFPRPLRLVYARVDPMVPPAVGPALKALVPDAELVWLDACSHFAQVDQPAAIVEQIERFDPATTAP